jgi:hypothetical protein
MNVKEIIKKYLKDEGYDGLSCPSFECGCYLDDLAPGDCLNVDECEAGHRAKDPSGENDWLIFPGLAEKGEKC